MPLGSFIASKPAWKSNHSPPPNSPSRKPPEKRNPSLSPTIAWWLLGVGIIVLVAVVYSQQDRSQKLTFGQFKELISKGNVEVTDAMEGKRFKYSHPTELLISPKDITGKVTREEIEDAKHPDADAKSAAADRSVTFHVNKTDKDDAALLKLLGDANFKDFDYSDGPSALTTIWLPYIFVGLLLAALFVYLARKLGGAGSPMAFGRSRGKMYAQEDLGITFDDVAGIDEAVEELREVVDFLRTPEKYQIAWRPNSQGRAAGRTAGHRQDAVGQGHRRRGGRAVFRPVRLAISWRCSSASAPRASAICSSRPRPKPLHHLHRRARRARQDPRHERRRRPRRTRANAQRPAGRNGRLRLE